MEEKPRQSGTPTKLRMRTAVGEIVEVQGGHIVRATGKKDRHSKVCTAKGPRDRRVRLAAHTAIQFYDVQDRLGYDRPSKAVDWLIKKAKSAIDELAELPPWNPATMMNSVKTQSSNPHPDFQFQFSEQVENFAPAGSGTRRRTTAAAAAAIQFQNFGEIGENENLSNNSSFFQPSLDSDAIDDTMKTFFPMGGTAETPSSSIQFDSFPPDLLSRTSSQSQDLRLSLQSFQEPVQTHHSEPMLFSGTTNGFDGSFTGWEQPTQNPVEITRFQRMVTWSSTSTGTGTGTDTGSGSGGGLLFNSPPLLPPFSGHNNSQFYSQRGPLQSSNTPSIRAWIDQPIAPTTNHFQIPLYQYPISSSGGFSGFRIPARIQGEEEEQDEDVFFHKPSSASSNSHH